MVPARCSSSVNEILKLKLKSLPNEDAQGNVHPLRRLYACSFASGARDTTESVTAWLPRWTTKPSHQPRGRGPRHHRKRDVVVRQVDDEAVEPVGDRRAGCTPRGVVRPEHVVIDEELRAPPDQVCPRGAPCVGLASAPIL